MGLGGCHSARRQAARVPVLEPGGTCLDLRDQEGHVNRTELGLENIIKELQNRKVRVCEHGQRDRESRASLRLPAGYAEHPDQRERLLNSIHDSMIF